MSDGVDERQRYAQRLHVVHSLGHVLQAFHVLSHLLSPSLWILFCRATSQVHFARPRERQKQLSLKLWICGVFLINIVPVLRHTLFGASTGGAAMLDFVGIASTPSRFRIASLDFLIVFLQLLQTYIAYESHLARHDPSQPDHLTSNPSPQGADLESSLKAPESTVIIDVNLRRVWQRLRHPPVALRGDMIGENDAPNLWNRTRNPLLSREFTLFPRAPRPIRPVRRRGEIEEAQEPLEEESAETRFPGGI